MPLAPDIQAFIENSFSASERTEVVRLIESAVLHDGQPAGLRCQRSALVASAGSLESLRLLVSQLAIDLRDVILAGEYEGHSGELRQVRDLEQPIIPGAA